MKIIIQKGIKDQERPVKEFTSKERQFMRAAIRLAQKGLGFTSPNPAVGAVIVKDGEIVGRGYHKRAGTAHAEVNAIKDAGERCRGAEIYVTLEPCNHTGRTPPCTRAILESGITRVVLGALDPNPSVKGGGAEYLASQGLRVDTGLLEKECMLLLAPFAKSVKKGLPWVRAKTACSIDGRIATRTGHSKWITNEKARGFGQKLRKISDAILVGRGTVQADDPSLTWRPGKRPLVPKRLLRVILDSRLESPADSKVFNVSEGAPTMVAVTRPDKKKAGFLEEIGVKIVKFPPDQTGRPDLEALLKYLGGMNIQSLLVEGGAGVLGSFYDQGLVDQAFFFFAPVVIGGEDARDAIGGLGPDRLHEAARLKDVTIRRLQDNWLVQGVVSDLEGLWRQ